MSEANVTGFSHVAILVSDIDRSAAWYEDVLEWKPTFEHRFDDGSLGRANLQGENGRVRMGEIGGVRLELVEMDRPKTPWTRPDQYGLFFVSVIVADAEVAHQKCVEKGVTICRDIHMGQTRVLVVADPDGQEIALVGRG